MSERCSLCGSMNAILEDTIHDYEYGVAWKSALHQCSDCGLVVQHPRVTPDQIESLYPDNYLAHSHASKGKGIYGRLKKILADRAAQKITRFLPDKGALLEVGCGNGSFLKTVHGMRSDVALFGVDIKKIQIDDVPNLTFFHSQLEDADIPENLCDVVYHSNLVEHVPDPEVFLKKCHSILKPGGIMVAITPNHLSLDRYIFRRYWAGYHYPRHTFVFNHHNIERLLDRAGLRLVQCRGSYAYWYLSLANRFVDRPGTKKRGLLFALVTALFLPFDLLVNLFRPHGSMTVIARKPGHTDESR